MSLIDEALKRAQAAQPEAAKEGAPPPWTPPPLPDPRRMRRRKAVRVLAVSLGAALLAAAVLLLLPRETSEQNRRAPQVAGRGEATPAIEESGATPALRESAVLAEITSEVLVTPPPRGEGKVASAQAQASRAAIELFAEASGEAAVRDDFPRTAPEEKAAESPPKAQPPLKGRIHLGEAALPGGGRIALEGIVFSEENPTALLNGRVLSPGGFVEGYEVVRVRADRVELRGEAGSIVIVLK